VLETCGAAGEHLTLDVRGPERPRDRLDRRQLQVLEALPAGRPGGLDNIARIAGIDVRETERHLVDLTRRGFAEQTRTGWRVTDLGRS
jgi:DNA processing protein